MAEGKSPPPARDSSPFPRAAIGSAKGGSGSVPGRGVRDGATLCHARGSAGRCGTGVVRRTSARLEEAVLLQSCCAGRESSSEGLLGAPCGARTTRTCPGAPGGRAELRAHGRHTAF